MRIVARKTLRLFWERHRDAEAALEAWYQDAKRANWNSSTDIRREYASASFVSNNRVVFNIKGNKFRVVVAVHYRTGIVYIRFVGTHQQYNLIDVSTI